MRSATVEHQKNTPARPKHYHYHICDGADDISRVENSTFDGFNASVKWNLHIWAPRRLNGLICSRQAFIAQMKQYIKTGIDLLYLLYVVL